MAEQTRIEKPTQTPQQKREQEAAQLAEQDAEVQAAQEKPAADTSELDEFLDEVDGLLEEMEVLTRYVQRGGE
jgi:hypothetical protein